MAYPDSIDVFSEKLDRRGDLYAITDEIISITNGMAQAFLVHDNVKNDSVELWTNPDRAGRKVVTYTLQNPKAAPWKTIITVYTNDPRVYVTYDTYGDQVEASDINDLQRSIIATQKEVEKVKANISGARAYIFDQMVSSDTWTIEHNLNRYPSVSVVDSGGNIVIGDVTYLSLNVIKITFSAPFGGRAYLN